MARTGVRPHDQHQVSSNPFFTGRELRAPASIDGLMYLVGAYDGGTHSSTVDAFDPGSVCYEVARSLPFLPPNA
jgi:hypothetical protein